MNKYLLIILSLLIGCSKNQTEEQKSDVSFLEDEIKEINTRLTSLSIISENLEEVISSEFESCLTLESNTIPLVQTICNVAQDESEQVRAELLGTLGSALSELNTRIDLANNDLAAHTMRIESLEIALDAASQSIDDINLELSSLSAQLSLLNAGLVTIQGEVALLDSRITSAESAIEALEDLVDEINQTLDRVLEPIAIGENNPAAGPLFEVVLRRVDKSRITGYVETYGTAISLPNNPVDPSNGSFSVDIDTGTSSHGLVIGDRVKLRDLSEGAGFTSGDLYGEFEITALPSLTEIRVSLRRNATSSADFGGSVGVLQKVGARGMSTLWKAGDASDAAVRQTTAGTRVYNFIIRQITSDSAEICWHSTIRTASFAVINAAPQGGSASVICQ